MQFVTLCIHLPMNTPDIIKFIMCKEIDIREGLQDLQESLFISLCHLDYAMLRLHFKGQRRILLPIFYIN